jgi:hypothetical protein
MDSPFATSVAIADAESGAPEEHVPVPVLS